MDQNKSFESHFKKLEEISRELQDNKIGIDQLVPKMKEALESIKVCKDVLQETELQIVAMSKEFESLMEKK